MDNNYMKVSFPLEGIYIYPNTPGSNIPSHGTDSFGETYAIDFVMIRDNDKLKKPYRNSFIEYVFKGLQLDNFYGWGQTVYSPVSGEVVGLENNIEERNPVNILNDYKNAKGLPFVFESYEIKQENKWVKMINSVPGKKDIIRYEIK